MKVALYARCSTSRQDYESQTRKLEEWARKQSHEFILKADYGSGKDFTRAGLNEALELARKKEIEAIAVIELSRIGRSIKEIYQIIEELDNLGVRIILISSGTMLNPNTMEGRALLGGLALAADLEWQLLKDRNARAREQIKIKGIKLGRKKKEVSDVAINALREKGLSIREIAKEMNVSIATIFRRLKDGHLCDISKSQGETKQTDQNLMSNETAFHK